MTDSHSRTGDDALTESGCSEHDCPWCPMEPRDLFATAHNAAGAVGRALNGQGGWERAHRKLRELEDTLTRYQPQLDAHFAREAKPDAPGERR